MNFSKAQCDFIKKEIGIDVLNKDVKDNSALEKISMEAFYIEGEESTDNKTVSERGKIAESIVNLFAGVKST